MDGSWWKTLLKRMIWGENPLFSETSIYLWKPTWSPKIPTNLPMIIPDWRFFKHPSAKPEAVGVSFTVTWMDGTWDPNELKQNEEHLIVYMILRRSPVEVGSLSHYLRRVHPKWCRISSSNSMCFLCFCVFFVLDNMVFSWYHFCIW